MSVALVRDVFKGALFLDSEHFESVLHTFVQNISLHKSKVQKDIEICKTCLERVDVLNKYFQWSPIPQKYFQRFGKSEDLSASFREVGNTAYKAQDVAHAFRGYNLALAFAPTGSEAQGLAYSNRSALFLYIDELDKAISDLDSALLYKLSEEVVRKLSTRREKCESLKKMNHPGSFGEDGKAFCEDKFLQLKSPSLFIKGGDDCIQIEFSPECGRRLIATKDIPPGTPMVVDRGFVTVLDRLKNWDTEHCAFCTKPILGGIPNSLTTFGLYCNKTCLNQALDTVSGNEHKYLPYIHSTQSFHDESLIILRILSKTGPEQLHKLWSCGQVIANQSEGITGLEDDGVYNPESYLPVFNLISHRIPLDFDDLTSLARSKEFKSIFLTNLLQQTTDFFERRTEPEFLVFVSSLILRLYESLEFNILSLCEWRTTSGPLSQPLWTSEAKKKSMGTTTSSYATGVFPLVALCNHSCDPNAIFIKGTKVDLSALLSSRLIRKGEELLISYKAPFTRMTFPDRQKYLLENYKFLCKCFACENRFSEDSTVKNPVLITGQMCDVKVKRLMDVVINLEFSKELIRAERFGRAFEVLVEEANFLSNFQSHFELVQICQDLFRKVIVQIMHL